MFSQEDINELENQFSKVVKMEDPAEKVKYFENELMKSKFLSKQKDEPIKFDNMALEYREAGNKAYKEKEHLIALLFYNKSLCFSRKESRNLALAYASK
jgi:hypothetical protein